MTDAVEPALQTQCFSYGEKRIERDFLRHDAHCHFGKARFFDRVAAEYVSASRIGFDEAGNGAD